MQASMSTSSSFFLEERKRDIDCRGRMWGPLFFSLAARTCLKQPWVNKAPVCPPNTAGRNAFLSNLMHKEGVAVSISHLRFLDLDSSSLF